MNNINKHKVIELPDCAYYIPNFVTQEEELELLDKIYSSPKPKWKTLSNRRLQNWGGLPHAKGMIEEELPEWLMGWVRRVSGVFGEAAPPNHVLVNEYLSGQGIMPHEDGPLFHPVIATISLGSHTVLDYYRKDLVLVGSLLLERRSLLVVEGALYTSHLHGIRAVGRDPLPSPSLLNPPPLPEGGGCLERGTRVSLTIRRVPKTLHPARIFGRTPK